MWLISKVTYLYNRAMINSVVMVTHYVMDTSGEVKIAFVIYVKLD